MSVVRGRLPARRVPLAPIDAGERWACRLCPGCQRRRMMPESEKVCLHCQEGVRPQVFGLPHLRAVRERAGYTLAELEDDTFIPRFRLRRIEQGRAKVKMKTARRIAGALGTTVETLATQNGKGAA